MEKEPWRGEIITIEFEIEEFALEGLARFEQLLRSHQQFANFLAERGQDTATAS